MGMWAIQMKGKIINIILKRVRIYLVAIVCLSIELIVIVNILNLQMPILLGLGDTVIS